MSQEDKSTYENMKLAVNFSLHSVKSVMAQRHFASPELYRMMMEAESALLSLQEEVDRELEKF